MYKILHIPTAKIVQEELRYFREDPDDIYINTILDVNNLNEYDMCPVLFYSKKSAEDYLNKHITYETPENSNIIYLYHRVMLNDVNVKPINKHEFEIIEHV